MWESGIVSRSLDHQGEYMKKRSKRYRALLAKIDRSKVYSLEEAIALIKEQTAQKFDAAVELHISTAIDVKQSDQHFRGTVSLPHGTGKKQKIAVITSDPVKAKAAGADIAGGEELIKEIKETQKFDFDVLISEPAFMPKLAPIAKILGPRGLMPSPKTGSVTDNVVKAIEELSAGKITFKNDSGGNAHLLVGKTSFAPEKLKENIQSAYDALRSSRPAAAKGVFIQNVTLAATMGPGIKVEVK